MCLFDLVETRVGTEKGMYKMEENWARSMNSRPYIYIYICECAYKHRSAVPGQRPMSNGNHRSLLHLVSEHFETDQGGGRQKMSRSGARAAPALLSAAARGAVALFAPGPIGPQTVPIGPYLPRTAARIVCRGRITNYVVMLSRCTAHCRNNCKIAKLQKLQILQ